MPVHSPAAARGAQSVVHHLSARVHCDAHQQPAVISVIERRDAQPPLRFVLWCSLRDIGCCSEGCLRRRNMT